MHINNDNNNQLKYNITVVTHHCKGECLHDHLLLILLVHLLLILLYVIHNFNVFLLLRPSKTTLNVYEYCLLFSIEAIAAAKKSNGPLMNSVTTNV